MLWKPDCSIVRFLTINSVQATLDTWLFCKAEKYYILGFLTLNNLMLSLFDLKATLAVTGCAHLNR